MKKTLYIFSLLLLSFLLVSCDNLKKPDVPPVEEPPVELPEVNLEEILNDLDVIYHEDDDNAHVFYNVTLIKVLDEYPDVLITWESNNNEVISSEGVVAVGDIDVLVTLTLTLTYEDEILSKEFNLLVRSKDTYTIIINNGLEDITYYEGKILV